VFLTKILWLVEMRYVAPTHHSVHKQQQLCMPISPIAKLAQTVAVMQNSNKLQVLEMP
jgi:hypothetical protein